MNVPDIEKVCLFCGKEVHENQNIILFLLSIPDWWHPVFRSHLKCVTEAAGEDFTKKLEKGRMPKPKP